MSGSSIPPKPMGTARALTKPSLRWRLRRWILQKLDAWPRERPEPRTEWGRMRREERERLVEENRRLRALVDRVESEWPSMVARVREELAAEAPRRPS